KPCASGGRGFSLSVRRIGYFITVSGTGRSALLATALLGDTLYLLVIVPLSPGLASGLFLRSANVTSVALDKAKPRRGGIGRVRGGSGARYHKENSPSHDSLPPLSVAVCSIPDSTERR